MKKLFIALLSMFMAVSVFNTLWAGNGQYDFSLRRGETRQTLSPDIFLNPVVRRAYAVAKRIPWVLDSIYCYCHCEESPTFRHKSLLSCYVDDHASQ